MAYLRRGSGSIRAGNNLFGDGKGLVRVGGGCRRDGGNLFDPDLTDAVSEWLKGVPDVVISVTESTAAGPEPIFWTRI